MKGTRRSGRKPPPPVVTHTYISDVDDDFVSSDDSPVARPTKKAFPSLSHRSTPRTIVDAVEKLNDMQRRAVYDMGFGAVFKILVREIPCRLAYWCVTNFVADTCTLLLPGGKEVHITEEDVWLTLGFPRGAVDIIRNPSFVKNEKVDKWARTLWKNKKEILSGDVLTAMLSDECGGDVFKKNFLILLEFCVIEGPSEGHVRPKIMDVLDDIPNIRNFNWCKYLLTTLVTSHKSWTSSKRGRFSGSVLFLMMFYVDRVEFLGRDVRRSFPTIKGWTSNDLKGRETKEIRRGGFGDGQLAERFAPSDDLVRETCFGEPANRHGAYDSVPPTDEIRYTNEVLKVAKDLTSGLAKLIRLISDAPRDVATSPCFQIAADACRHMFNIPSTLPQSGGSETNDEGPQATQRMAASCSQWSNPEWDACLVEMMKVWEIRNNVAAGCSQEYPSFSLGFTQEFGDVELTPPSKTPAADVHTLDVCDPSSPHTPVDDATLAAAAKIDVHADESADGGGKGSADVHTPGVCDPPLPIDDVVRSEQSGRSGGDENADVHAPVMCDPPSPHTPVDDADLDKVSGPGMELCVIGGKIVPVFPKGTNVQSAIDAVPLRMEPAKRKAKGKDKIVDEETRPKIVRRASDRDKAKESVNAPRVATRGQSKVKPSSNLTSPYMVREVPVTMKLTKNEKVLFAWLLSSDNADGFDFVFEHESVKLTFDDARTMAPGCLVACGVLNAWSRFLNLRERLKAAESYSRFYFSTYPVLSTVVDPEKSWSALQAFEHFASRVDNELAQVEEHVDIEFIDLVFFPVWQDNHYYVIVFNFRAKDVAIIDNSDAVDDEPMSTKYNRIPQRLYKFFMAYLKTRLMLTKTNGMCSESIYRMKMSWRNTANKKDCAVYAMRHMEMYKGEKGNSWKIGLPKDKDHTRQLQYLRARYAGVLRSAECNSRAGQNSVASGIHHARSVENDAVLDVVALLNNYVES